MSHPPNPPSRTRPQRADAQRSIARILDAALEGLSADPEVSMGAIARRAGVTRATVYVHFSDRESLIAAVTHRAIAEATEVIDEAQPAVGEPVEALARVTSAAWRTLARFHALVAINAELPAEEFHHLHGSALGALQPLIERGQAAGAFRADVPPAWHLASLLALIHGASAEVHAGRIAEDQVEDALVAGVVGALTADGTTGTAHGTTGGSR